MAGRPPHGAHHDLLLDLDDQPAYSPGQRSALTDDDILRAHAYDHDDAPPRPSVSYDDFVGAPLPSAGFSSTLPSPSAVSPAGAPLAYSDTSAAARQFSQTSELGNYQRYADDYSDDYPDDGNSYYQHGGPNPGDQGAYAAHAPRPSKNRNSILSMGGGLVGRAKNMLGMGEGYSEMDLPLTEPGSANRTNPIGAHGAKPHEAGARKFKFGFGRSKPDPSTLGPRIIHLNNPPANQANKYVDNHVSTAKYNVATFIPKFLFEQFSKYANVFFLFTSGLQQIPNLSPTNQYTTIGPLFVVLLISAGKELVEDYRRKQADRSLNLSKTRVLRGSNFDDAKWINVQVGDVVRVQSEESFPADLVLLASSEPEGLCYIETANLDGETNLKIKQAIPETASLVSSSDLGRLGGQVRSEQPNSSLYTYEATLTMQAGAGEKELALNPEQLLLRGATLRNTPWIHGLVVFTGHETKLMRNATATPIKRTKVEKQMNLLVLMLVGTLLVLSVVCTVGDLITRSVHADSLTYLSLTKINSVGLVAKQFAEDMVTYWVLFSALVPISLFVTVELVKYWHGILINDDLDIYYDKTDTPANCRTSSLVEELGMVEYIFSDKTGTLTCNMMEFKQCTIDGKMYADDVPEDRRATEPDSETGIHDFKTLGQDLAKAKAPEELAILQSTAAKHRRTLETSRDLDPDQEDKLMAAIESAEAQFAAHKKAATMQQFLALLSTCHTVIPERDSSGNIKYQAASPDEGALVEGAAMLGYKFVARKPRSVILEVGGREDEYTLLAVCEFNSTRKRMSAIYRCPDGKIRCYCKGADTVITMRLQEGVNPHLDATNRHLEEYASEGLRTLCLASREIEEQEFQEWYQIFDKASTTMGGDRADELDKAAELIEKDFTLLGATAIEDKLQDGVPETIHTLQQAGIKVWVLTGDRQETAINIGMSCKLLSEDMVLLVVNEETAAATRNNLQNALEGIKTHGDGSIENETLALIIDGKSLTFALEKELEKTFLELAVMCKAVVCCRVSPLQKALVVKLVKKYRKQSILLAIGDGANDVSMIQAAHIGVGISGMEGLQAARSADVSIGQFRFLRKLLLVHGAWSYHRVSKTILFSFYKNITLYLTQFWYTFQNVFSGMIIYESWTLSLYNVIFTVLPPLALGILDQFVSARLLDRYPQLYTLGQTNQFFRMRVFVSWIANAVYHSLLLYVFGVLLWPNDGVQGDGQVAGHWVWGTAMYGAVLLTVLGKAGLITNNWTKYHVVAIPGSMALFLGFIAAYATIAPMADVSEEYHGLVPRLFTSPVFWLQMLALPVLCLSRDVAYKFGKRMYKPQTYHHIQEIQKYNIQDYRPRMEQFQKAIRKVRQVQRQRKQRGYAFSQADESQTRVLQAYDTTQTRGRYGEMVSSRPEQPKGQQAWQ